MEALAWLGKYWAMIWAGLSTAGFVVMALLSKTYAKRDDLNDLKQRVTQVEDAVSGLPKKEDLHALALEMASLRGEISQLTPRLDGVQRLSDLLLENELQEKKSQ